MHRALLLAAALPLACLRADDALPPIPSGPPMHALLTAQIAAERSEFWAVDSSETRFASLGELYAAKPDEAARTALGLAFWAQRNASFESVTGMHALRDTRDDLEHSAATVARVLRTRPAAGGGGGGGGARCLNIAAGIGREAAHALAPGGCDVLDLLEPQAAYAEVARARVPAARLGRVFTALAQDHDFGADKYDVIFVGWCVQFIPDGAFVALMRRAAGALREGGVLIVKDNVSDFADAV